MRLEELFETLENRVDRECQALHIAAEEEAAAILFDAHEEVERQRIEALATQRAEAETQLRKVQEQAEARRGVDEAAMRHQVADEVLGHVPAHLERMAQSPDFGFVVEALLAEALASLPGATAVGAPVVHVERCRAWLQQHGYAQVTVEADPDLRDGVTAFEPTGRSRVTNTLTSRFERMKEAARKRCLERLYGEEA